MLTTSLNALTPYTRHTADFINKINEAENITKETFIVTLDVKFLNTNIPNHKGIEAAKKPLKLSPLKANRNKSYYQSSISNINAKQFLFSRYTNADMKF